MFSSRKPHSVSRFRFPAFSLLFLSGLLFPASCLLSAADLLAVIPLEHADQRSRTMPVLEEFEQTALILAESSDLSRLSQIGGQVLDDNPNNKLYYVLRPRSAELPLSIRNWGSVQYAEGLNYLVRVSPKYRHRVYDLRNIEYRMLSTEPSGRVTLPGALSGLTFAGALIAVLVWLLAVPPQVAAVAAHARRVVSAIRRIVVPADPHTNWERAVELACRLGEDQKAEILVTSVIEIPFTLSLNAPMEKTEKLALETLGRAAEIVEHHGLPVRTKVERARQVGEGIARLARDAEADLIVLATRKHRALRLDRTVEILLQRAPCEVIIDSVPEKSAAEPVLDPGGQTP
jgi:nucleotide-binding universal stress UspA family protein